MSLWSLQSSHASSFRVSHLTQTSFESSLRSWTFGCSSTYRNPFWSFLSSAIAKFSASPRFSYFSIY